MMTDLFGNDRKTVYSGLYAGRVDGKRAGEQCRDCAHCIRFVRSRIHYKCGQMRADWTHSRKTDICITRSACMYFQPMKDKQ